MRFPSSRLALLAAAALTFSTAAVAVAQDGPPPPGPPPMMDDGPGGPGGPMMRHHRFDPEAHAQHLRDVLQLRPDQDGALRAYLAALEPRDRADGKPMGDEDGPRVPPTTPERLDREAERMDRSAEAFKVRAAATRAFYAALSPSQRKAFDALGPMLGGPGPMMRGMEGRRMKGGPDGAPVPPGHRKPGRG